ncbi:hypothetical protein BH11PLA1_BH11PLA1_08120 [soil metagenome]
MVSAIRSITSGPSANEFPATNVSRRGLISIKQGTNASSIIIAENRNGAIATLSDSFPHGIDAPGKYKIASAMITAITTSAAPKIRIQNHGFKNPSLLTSAIDRLTVSRYGSIQLIFSTFPTPNPNPQLPNPHRGKHLHTLQLCHPATPLPLPFLVLQIGHVKLETNLLLAPIAGYCDLAFRLVCREQGGVGLACTDLLSPQGLLRGTATSLDLARTNAADKPVGMQLYGGDPEIMAQGALWAAEHGATIVDINMGCPVDKVTKKDGGSKLLCIPDTTIEIVRRCARALAPFNIPLTCKMRLGWFDGHPIAESLAPRLIDEGIAAVTIHGRTTQQKFSGTVQLDGIARVVEAVGNACRAPGQRVPVIGNGDIREPEDALAMIRRTGCDGVMIGRGALSTPWLFRDCWSLLTTGAVAPEPTTPEKIAIVRRYFSLMLEFRDERYAMYQIRRRITWFAKRLGREVDERNRPVGCRGLKETIRAAVAPADVFAALALYESGGLRGAEPHAPDARQDEAKIREILGPNQSPLLAYRTITRHD